MSHTKTSPRRRTVRAPITRPVASLFANALEPLEFRRLLCGGVPHHEMPAVAAAVAAAAEHAAAGHAGHEHLAHDHAEDHHSDHDHAGHDHAEDEHDVVTLTGVPGVDFQDLDEDGRPDVFPGQIFDLDDGHGHGHDDRAQVASRWTQTASGSTGSVGRGITLTWSIVPDGTTLPAGGGAGSGPSGLIATLNSIYGSQAVWQPLFEQMFNAWSNATGITYIFQPTDDGVPVGDANPGVLSVRGDVRIGGKFIDGPSNVLAFNSFPNNGDMVIDTSDFSAGGFFGVLGGNSIRLRTVLAHEHGHGLGLAHVCPGNGTKLMEPFISTLYNTIPFDDRLGGQRNYGDRFEKGLGNNSVATATDIGNVAVGSLALGIANVSTSANTDVDVYKFTLTTPGALTVTAFPVGSDYLQGPQTPNCTEGSTFSPQSQANLRLELLNADGAVIAIASGNPIGVQESIGNIGLPSGVYYARVSAPPPSPNNAQMYELSVFAVADTVAPTVTSSQFTFEAAQTVTFVFSENVLGSLQPEDFAVLNLTTNQTFTPANVVYGAPTNTATVTFGSTLPDGNYELTLDAADVTDGSGNALAAPETLSFFVFAGDANRDRTINIQDFGLLAANFNSTATFSTGDFNYDGAANIQDFGILAGKFNQSLPEPGARPGAVASAASAPARKPAVAASPFSVVGLVESDRLDREDAGVLVGAI